MIKKVFKIDGMHCTACAMDIDGTLEDTKGVKEACTNYARQQVEVEFDPTMLKEEQVIKIIKNLGYNAQLM